MASAGRKRGEEDVGGGGKGASVGTHEILDRVFEFSKFFQKSIYITILETTDRRPATLRAEIWKI
jgi:hypothetical protein